MKETTNQAKCFNQPGIENAAGLPGTRSSNLHLDISFSLISPTNPLVARRFDLKELREEMARIYPTVGAFLTQGAT
jgi:hypothetical protein